MTARLIIEHPGLMTTVQDLGRFGAQALGIPVSGALDTVSLRLANALVGNSPDSAGLEIRMMGPVIRIAGGAVRVALIGTETQLEIVGESARTVPSGQSVLLAEDTTFRIGPTPDTAVCYLAVQGSFALTPEFGSCATYEPGRLGGVHGRALIKGDTIVISGDGSAQRSERRAGKKDKTKLDGPIRVVLGPQHDHFTEAAVRKFLTATYRVSPKSNRMGLQLEGDILEHSAGHDIASDGIVAGSVQVPGNGLPIVLLADRQTTGGYPKIATVASADLPRLGRMLAGTSIRFTAIDVGEAETLRRNAERTLEQEIKGIENVATNHGDLEAILMRENLISGIVGPDDASS